MKKKKYTLDQFMKQKFYTANGEKSFKEIVNDFNKYSEFYQDICRAIVKKSGLLENEYGTAHTKNV